VNLLILSPSVPKTDSDDKITVGFSFQTDSDNNNKKKIKKIVPNTRHPREDRKAKGVDIGGTGEPHDPTNGGRDN
jgi:hypothetical protein